MSDQKVVGGVSIRQTSTKVVPIKKESKTLTTPGLRSVYFCRSTKDNLEGDPFTLPLSKLADDVEAHFSTMPNVEILGITNSTAVDKIKSGRSLKDVTTFICHVVYKI